MSSGRSTKALFSCSMVSATRQAPMQTIDKRSGGPEDRGNAMRSESTAQRAISDASSTSEDRSRGTLTKREIAHVVYSACPGLSRRQAKELIDAVLEEIVSTLVAGEDVSLRGFGKFAIRHEARAPRAQSEDGRRGANHRPQGCHIQGIGNPEDPGGRRMRLRCVAGGEHGALDRRPRCDVRSTPAMHPASRD